MTLRVLIVDDEPLGRRRVRGLLEREPDVAVAGECGDGESAVTAIQGLAPDLVFLDVQMPALDAFGVIRQVGPERMPPVVFVTAYDQYALRAFEVNALDYLVKPVDRERFAEALRRARERQSNGAHDELSRRLTRALETAALRDARLDRVAVRSDGKIRFVETEAITWVEADGNHVRIHAGENIYSLRSTLQGLHARLDPARFLRVSRSAILNIAHLKELQPWFHGDLIAILRDGTRLSVSRGYRQELDRYLKLES